ncbi:MAG TPA: T9SS type A sorting domain-containing protein, partial [Patescibacteria group bacterium]|nr:T9SS type A sorting domain-containing protein [Patescibacteria group bacterium]
RLTGFLTDPYKDGFYTVRTIDSIGNVSELRDTIQGFTINFPGISGIGPAITYKDKSIGFMSCDSLKISNYGLLPFVFNTPYMLKNLYFSMPQVQFPLTLMPGEERWIQVCYRPLETHLEGFQDTLIFTHNCLVQAIPLHGESIATTYSANAQCDVRVMLSTSRVPPTSILEQNIPNPVQGETRVAFALKEAGRVKIALYDTRGILVTTIVDKYQEAGIYEMQFMPKDIPNGIYFYELQAGSDRISRMMVITR